VYDNLGTAWAAALFVDCLLLAVEFDESGRGEFSVERQRLAQAAIAHEAALKALIRAAVALNTTSAGRRRGKEA
jgi:hypothetical protein